jgi:hypothetical protein
VTAAADLLARELGWDVARVTRETAAVDALYPAL